VSETDRQTDRQTDRHREYEVARGFNMNMKCWDFKVYKLSKRQTSVSLDLALKIPFINTGA